MSTTRTTVRRSLKAAALAGAVLLLGLGAATPAVHASFVVTVSEVGSDVVTTGGGSLDLSGLVEAGFGIGTSGRLFPDVGLIVIGPTTSVDLLVFEGFSGPSSFGPGDLTGADSGVGDTVGVLQVIGVIGVPTGYSSGDPLSGSSTYAGGTFASLGLTPGVYTFTLPNDTFTVVIGAAVPVPATLLLLVSAVVGVGAVRTWRRR